MTEPLHKYIVADKIDWSRSARLQQGRRMYIQDIKRQAEIEGSVRLVPILLEVLFKFLCLAMPNLNGSDGRIIRFL